MIKILLSSLLFTSQAFAGLPPTTIKGQSDSGKATTFNFEVPYNQATSTAAVTKLLETGNNNLLLNPSFEGETQTTGWTVGTGVTPSAGSTFTHGKKSLHANMVNVSGNVYSQSVTPGVTTLGRNFEHSIWLKNSAPNIQVCALQAGVAVAGQCIEASQDNLWHQYQFFLAGPSSGSIGIGVSTFALASGNLDIDEAYVGIARLGQGTPPNTFTAQVAANGVVTNETPQDWINGNFVITDTSLFTGTYVSGLATSPMTCVTNFVGIELGANGRSNIETQTSTAVGVRTGYSQTSTSFTKQPYQFNITCTKTGSDFVQNTITAQNYDYTGQDCTITGNWVTNTTYACKESRKGRWAIYDIFVNTSGAPTAANLILTLPSGRVIDTAVLATTLPTSAAIPADSGYVLDAGVATYPARVSYLSTTTVAAYVLKSDGTYTVNDNITNLKPHTFGASDQVNLTFAVPIVGWSETQNAPQLLGSVTSDALVSDKYYRGAITNNGTTCVASDFNVAPTSVSRSGNGTCVATWPSAFSSRPVCNVTSANSSVPGARNGSFTTTTHEVVTYAISGGVAVATDGAYTYHCVGPR